MTNKILKTTGYSLFTFIKGNRPINYTHVGNLVASIKEKDLAMPIIVDQNMNVVDGQHRLKAYEILSKPVTYIIKKDFNLTDIRQVNSVQKHRTPLTYINSSAQICKDEYVYLDCFYRT